MDEFLRDVEAAEARRATPMLQRRCEKQVGQRSGEELGDVFAIF
jgi:hypothetical protein